MRRLVPLPPASCLPPLFAAFASLARAQECSPDWIPTFGEKSGTNFPVEALAVFDDGSGPALYAAGSFTTAGGHAASRVATWDGHEWSALGSGVDDVVHALTVFDDGSGAALYAAGQFQTAGGVDANRIARWDGDSWSPLGSGIGEEFETVRALAVFDDGSGSGPALYAGGRFTTAGGASANHVARWNGESWSALGGGVGLTGNLQVNALAVFDDGSGAGPALYVGGDFDFAGGVAAKQIARWDGESWSALGAGIDGLVSPTSPDPEVLALAVFDDGSGSGAALYAGGGFTKAGGLSASHVARWDGQAWTALGDGLNDEVDSLLAFDDGSGPSLVVGGAFTGAGSVEAGGIATWDGASWSPLESGMVGFFGPASVRALAAFDDGAGPVSCTPAARSKARADTPPSGSPAGTGRAGRRSRRASMPRSSP